MSKTPLTRALAGFSGMLALILLLVGCGGSSTSSTTPSAQTLIKNAQAAIQKVSSYHFNLKAQNIGTSGQLPIQSADGDIVVPDKLQATADVIFSGSTVQAQMIAIGNKQYLNILGGWQQTTGLLILAYSQIRKPAWQPCWPVENPSTPTSSSSDGTPCWSINGKLDASYLSGITGGGAPAGTQDNVTTCIGKSDNLPYLIVVTGIAATGDTAQTVRTFKLSKFNEKITINPPITANKAATQQIS